jgi:hypothetical protein
MNIEGEEAPFYPYFEGEDIDPEPEDEGVVIAVRRPVAIAAIQAAQAIKTSLDNQLGPNPFEVLEFEAGAQWTNNKFTIVVATDGWDDVNTPWQTAPNNTLFVLSINSTTSNGFAQAVNQIKQIIANPPAVQGASRRKTKKASKRRSRKTRSKKTRQRRN